MSRADELGDDEPGDGAGGDAGERVGEDPADGDRGVRERRGGGEPVGGADVGADGGRGEDAAAGAGEREDERDEPAVATTSPSHRWCSGPVLAGQLADGHLEHEVGQHGAGDGADDLGDGVGDRPRRRTSRCRARRPSSQSAADTTGLKCAPETGPNSRMSTVNPKDRGGGVLQQLQADVAGREAFGCDAGPDDDGDEQGGAEELGSESPSQVGRPRCGAGHRLGVSFAVSSGPGAVRR